jgi:hypothetical protein
MLKSKNDVVYEKKQDAANQTGNNLFPVFLKLETLKLLIVGGGNIALEKLQAVLQNSPATKITVVAIDFTAAIRNRVRHHENVALLEKAYERADLDDADVVIVAVNDVFLSEQIRNDAQKKGKLVNVADKPELCDFYLSSVVKKGNLKIAISTNGKSPTVAKRLKETFNDLLPAEIDDVLNNMEVIRDKMKGDFSTKVHRLNRLPKC